jgi:hypothetical protein
MSHNFPSSILDPRGIQHRELLNLAKRPKLEALIAGPIVLYNNTKLFHNNYLAIFERTKENFIKEGISNFIEFIETPRGKSNQELKAFAMKLARVEPVAAIVALGDIGVSPACTIITIELEKLGIPTLYYTAPPGTALVKAVANYRSGRLCIVSLDIYQGSSIEEINAEVDAQWHSVMDSLLLPPGKIENRANLDFVLDSDITGIDKPKDLAERIEVTESSFQEASSGIDEINDLFNELHISDGLPIIPPTERRYQKMLAYCPFDPDAVLAKEIGPSGKDIIVRDVVIAAVMAGCKPEYMPFLITAFRAMANEKYNFFQSVTTSHPGGNLVLVSGPLAQQVGLHGGQGCLGPGFRANLTIGRAVNLTIINVCRSIPGFSDLANISSQAELTYCFAEDPSITPWETMNKERFDAQTSIVYLLKAEPNHDIIDFLSPSAESLLETIVDCSTTLGSNNAYITGPLLVILTPDHASLLKREGWDKARIRKHIHAHAVNDANKLKNRGINPVRPKGFAEMDFIPVTRGPEDIEIIIAGGRGGHSAIILPWALHSEGIVERILLPDGTVPRSIEDFRLK